MGKIKDLTGDRFGRLKILYFDGFYRTSGKIGLLGDVNVIVVTKKQFVQRI